MLTVANNGSYAAVVEPVENVCRYSCKICKTMNKCYDTETKTSFWLHIAEEHDKDENSYRRAHGDPCAVIVTINCPECMAPIYNDPDYISAHNLTHQPAYQDGTLNEEHETFKHTKP